MPFVPSGRFSWRSWRLRSEIVSWFPKGCIVVPYDFSEQSRQALQVARDLVADLTRIHVVHVLPVVTVAEPGMIWDAVDNQARVKDAERNFREGPASAPFQKVDFNVVFGDPGREIAAFAERQKADLIVMPSHGRSGVSRLLIGSVAERVVRLAHCPVLILRGLSVKRP
jgi:nucleotide-binding universal stress UspA family protein